MVDNGDVDAFKKLRRWDDHEIAGLRRMYARPLFVVVGIFGVLLVRFSRVFVELPHTVLGTAPWHGGKRRIYACPS